MKQTVYDFCYKLMLKDPSPHMVALSSAVGAYIACSPYVGFHTVMVFLFSWVFGLNGGIVMIFNCAINNPWTMVPVYAAGYSLGDWILRICCGLNMVQYNPLWMTKANSFIGYYTGMHAVSLWSFMLGGNLLGLLLASILYCVVKYVCTKIAPTIHASSHLGSV